MQPYPSYRNSGVEWLGEVPEHWEVRRLKHWLEINRQVLPEDTDPQYEFDYLDIGSVGTGRLTQTPKRLRFGNAPSRARRIVTHGDTIISTVRTYLKAVWYAKSSGERLIASTGLAVLTPLRNAAPEFVSYTCQSDPFTDRVTAESVGIAYPAISEARFGTFSVCVPPLAEQRAIARFLDHADGRIRRYIWAKERLIELLEERKQAIIHEAVTGRINVRTGQPYPAYKDSGVEWLGDIPQHWEIRRLKHWLEINRQVLPEDSDPEYAFDYLDIGSVATGGLTEPPKRMRFGNAPSRARRIVAQGDTIVSTVRTYLKAVWYAKDPEEALIASTGFAVLTPGRSAAPEFVGYTCRSDPFTIRVTAESVGTAYPAISETRFGTLAVCVPPLPEQTVIARFLDNRTSTIDRTLELTRGQIDLLKEYRTRLIADVVTGKLDVREAAARLPETDPVAGIHDRTATIPTESNPHSTESHMTKEASA